MGSLREHWLETQSKRRDTERLESRPGRLDRSRILATEALKADQEEAECHFNEALQELLSMDVYLLDPVRGVALIPFRKDDDLAWYVFDQFNKEGLTGWRYHNDPLEQCRPLVPTIDVPPGGTPPVASESVN
jgi:hypothetical protein